MTHGTPPLDALSTVTGMLAAPGPFLTLFRPTFARTGVQRADRERVLTVDRPAAASCGNRLPGWPAAQYP
ncbi:hypothetical protein GCM10009665_14190 [Kitasatospora nipponensis]|uniref:Uncharacterized protein n=1 Tax=Kitasatospora nipponensis TaxID=258049 RepID=A0ABP4GHD6_9ACTN